MDVSKRKNIRHVEPNIVGHADSGIRLRASLGVFEIAVKHLVEYPVIRT